MFETSKDVLYIVISFCILWITAFLCWVFYYLAKVLRQTSQIVDEFRVRLQVISTAIDYIRGRVENISSLLTLATNGVSGLIKKTVANKAKEWVEGGTGQFNKAAKEAVDKAVEATAKGMKKAARKVKY